MKPIIQDLINAQVEVNRAVFEGNQKEPRVEYLRACAVGAIKDLEQFLSQFEVKTITVKNVIIGDKFVASNDTRSKRISTVVDFLKVVSITTGKDTGSVICVAEKEFMGKKERFETPFATVVRNKIKN